MWTIRQMGEKIIGLGWQIIAFCLPQSLWHRLIRSRFKAFIKAVEAEVTDRFLELLLNGMRAGFILIPDYRRNLYGWSGTLVFCTREKQIEATTHFKNGRMYVDETMVFKGNSTVVFKDGAALRSFLFSKDQDIFNSLLANTVEVEGNLNYVCKFGFMAKDLLHRLGIAR